MGTCDIFEVWGASFGTEWNFLFVRGTRHKQQCFRGMTDAMPESHPDLKARSGSSASSLKRLGAWHALAHGCLQKLLPVVMSSSAKPEPYACFALAVCLSRCIRPICAPFAHLQP